MYNMYTHYNYIYIYLKLFKNYLVAWGIYLQ